MNAKTVKIQTVNVHNEALQMTAKYVYFGQLTTSLGGKPIITTINA